MVCWVCGHNCRVLFRRSSVGFGWEVGRLIVPNRKLVGATGSRSGGIESVSVVSKSESFSNACRGSKVGRRSAIESYKEV